jgi:hypothetical protein
MPVVSRQSPVLRIGAVELVDSHKPDAIRVKPFVAVTQSPDAGHQSPARQDGQPTANSRLETALRRFRPPLKVNVEVREKQPVRVAIAFGSRFANSQQPTADCLLWAAGPWHESGEWWTGQPWSRETWDVVLKSEGAVGVYRIFRDALRDEWFMEPELCTRTDLRTPFFSQSLGLLRACPRDCAGSSFTFTLSSAFSFPTFLP